MQKPEMVREGPLSLHGLSAIGMALTAGVHLVGVALMAFSAVGRLAMD